jgi:predicted ATPase
LELLSVLNRMSTQGHAQFIIATHSPILLACPGAVILSFDDYPIKTIQYEETAYYKLYKAFMEDRDRILADI